MVEPKAGKPKPSREQPWAVRGVSIEARSKAAAAAQIAGMSLGKWLDRMIIETAHGQVSSRKEVGPTQEQMVADLVTSVQRLTDRLDQQERDRQQHQARGFIGLLTGLFGRSGKSR